MHKKDRDIETTNTEDRDETSQTAPNVFGGVYSPVIHDPGDIPVAGDADPGDTESANETGQGGDPDEKKKRKAFDYA